VGDVEQSKWTQVKNARIRAEVELLAPVEREYFEERAGILEYGSTMERTAAEALALQQTNAMFRK
jgi:hypothetical protein